MLNSTGKSPIKDRGRDAARCYKRGGSRTLDGATALAKARENFAFNLHLWLLVRRMSFADLSRATGATQSLLSKWRNQKQFPHPEALDAMSRALDIPLNYLFLDWDYFFDQTSTSLLPEFEAIRQSGVPAALKAGDLERAVSELSLMAAKRSSVAKTLKPLLQSQMKKPVGDS